MGTPETLHSSIVCAEEPRLGGGARLQCPMSHSKGHGNNRQRVPAGESFTRIRPLEQVHKLQLRRCMLARRFFVYCRCTSPIFAAPLFGRGFFQTPVQSNQCNSGTGVFQELTPASFLQEIHYASSPKDQTLGEQRCRNFALPLPSADLDVLPGLENCPAIRRKSYNKFEKLRPERSLWSRR